MGQGNPRRARYAERFPQVVWDYRTSLIERPDGFVDGLNCLTALARQHRFTNAVRHAFEQLDADEAVAATHLFVAFCGLSDLAALPEVRELEKSLQVWDDRTSILEQHQVLRTVQQELSELQEKNEEIEHYIRTMGRFSIYTRTRLDYEHTLMRLTPEQEDAVGMVSGEADALIRGGAGTGKSLVLIEAKFEDYVAQVLGLEAVRELVGTVDTFVLERLQRINPAYHFDFELVRREADAKNTTGFFTDAELGAEIESFLFANFVSRQEYVEQTMPRVGMRRRLSRGQREVVWQIREEIS